jgi:triacylglycerol esterase/lipase EstA (alpha/beta hydrolase family)
MMTLTLLIPSLAFAGRDTAAAAPAPVTDYITYLPAPAELAQNGVNGILDPGEPGIPGHIIIGAIPPNVDYTKPPIVFVQGKNGNAATWYGDTFYYGTNDMYEYAYNNGFRTAFVEMWDSDGSGSYSQYDNGQLLRAQLETIYETFGNTKLSVVAHSKGGPDTQAALVYYGGYDYVGRVVTLGSPHYGSPLADLAFSTWVGWLAELIGQRDDGTYSLQLGEMGYYRNVIDSNPNVTRNEYFTLSGTSKGPLFTALWFGGQYLSFQGANDGLVNQWSTPLPYGTVLFNDNKLDHDSVRIGNKVFNRIKSTLSTSGTSATADNEAELADIFGVLGDADPVGTDDGAAFEPAPTPEVSTSNYLYGAPLTAGTNDKHSFYVDTTLANLTVVTANPQTTVTLISPSGVSYQSDLKTQETQPDAIFKGAIYNSFTGLPTEIGEWTLNVESVTSDAYFMLASFADDSLGFSMEALQYSGAASFNLNPAYGAYQSLNISTSISDRAGTRIDAQVDVLSHFATSGGGTLTLPVLKAGATSNITFNITGVKADGTPFNRTIVQSVYVQ